MSFSSYLAAIADSDLFGLLAAYCLFIALLGLLERYRSTRTYRVMAFFGLMILPVLHGLGTYFLNQAPA